MSLQITLETWRSKSPAELATLMFQPGGAVSQHLASYAFNGVQARYAEAVIATLQRAETPQATITFAEAGTGVGKTLGYLVPTLVYSALTRQRILVSTYTLELQRQIFRDDGPLALRIVEQLTGKKPVIAPRRARSNFASPSRCRRLAAVETPARAVALANLAAFADQALASTNTTEDPWSRIEAGLIDAWREDNQELAEQIADLDTSAYALDSASPPDEQALWAASIGLADDANCLIATHASTIIDMKLWGALHGAKEQPFAIAILDEADQIEQAAHSALGVERSVPGMMFRLRALQSALAAAPLAADLRQQISGPIIDALSKAEPLAEEARALVPARGPQNVAVQTSAPWLEPLRSVADAMDAVIRVGKAIEDPGFRDELHALTRTHADILTFLECLDEPVDNAGRRAGRASLSFSPVSQAPSMVVHAIAGGRIMSRLWNDKAELCRSVFVTSATLAFPGKPAATAFSYIAKALGVRDEARINQDLNVQLEPANFGHPTFVLAHPSAPSPNREDDQKELRGEQWLIYAADAIVAAAAKSRGRTLVLTTSHADATHIAARIGDRLNDRLFVRGPRDSLKRTLNDASAHDNGVVIAAGAWQGLNKPGFFKTGVIARLPFTPRPSVPIEGASEAPPTFSMWNMVRLLRQGIGRFIRSASDAPDIWIVDPRIGLPASKRNVLVGDQFLTPHPQSQKVYLTAAIPTRFIRALNAAELFAPLSKPKSAPSPKRGKKKAAA